MGIYSDVSIKIGDQIIDEFIDIKLRQEMLTHHHLIITIRHDQVFQSGSLIDDIGKLIGKNAKLTVKSLDQDNFEFIGIVCEVKNTVSDYMRGHIAQIHAFSPDIQMSGVKDFWAYEQERLDDIVKEVTERYSINTLSIKPTDNPRLNYTVQFSEDGYEFIKRLAIRHGQWFFYDGNTLHFGTLPQKTSTLEYGKDLHEINLSQNLKSVFFKFSAHNYYLDRTDTEDLFSETIGKWISEKNVPKSSKHAFEESKNVYKRHPNHYYQGSFAEHPGHTGDLNSITKLSRSASISNMMFCHGKSNNAGLILGSVIDINSTKGKHGKFLIIRLKHFFDLNGNYFNEFVGVPADVKHPPYTNPEIISYAEPHSAIVTDNSDPDEMGRVRVAFFWGNQHRLETPWLRIVSPYAGSSKGMHFIPEIDEEVLVGFENGNCERPFVMGSLYNGQNTPLKRWKTKSNDFKTIRTRSGHTIEFIDKSGSEEIKIYDNDAEDYNYSITLASHSKQILIEAKGDMEIKADNLRITANKELEIKADNIKQSASSNVDISANSNMSIKSVSKMSLDGGAQMEQKASAKMTINGGGQLEQKAAIVKIN